MEWIQGRWDRARRRVCGRLAVAALIVLSAGLAPASGQRAGRGGEHWVGTWAAAPQPSLPKVQTFHDQTLRLIVHTSAAGTKVRIRLSNTYGDQPLQIGSAHVARRAAAADIDPAFDRALTFQGQPSVTVPAGATVVSDPVELEAPALSDLAVSLFLPQDAAAATLHILAKQSSYVSSASGDHTADAKFPVGKTIHNWPFLTGVDVAASPRSAAIVAFGSSLTDGDGTTSDTNRRWPNVLAERLQKSGGGNAEVGVLNAGIIGNRLLRGSPTQPGFKFGASLGQAGLARFERDVLTQPGVKYVIVGIGINDIAFPGSFTPAAEKVSAQEIIAGYRQLIARAHKRGVRVIGTTNPPFEDATFNDPQFANIYTPEKEAKRQKVNAWIRRSGAFDAVIDFDEVLRDPGRPTRILPAYDSGDHLHPNDAGCAAEGNAVPLALFEGR